MAAGMNQQSVRRVFLWCIGAIYLFAFSSLYLQIPGLYGRHGLLPAKLMLREDSSSAMENFQKKPTLLWFGPSLGLNTETSMELICLIGIVVSMMTMISNAWKNFLVYFILWALYFSVYQVGQTFLWFQWDILLLEVGFLCILVAPWTIFKTNFGRLVSRPHDGVTLWLVKWLLFRLMFASGVVKLTSRCPTWWGLTALNWHYESQCIPTPLAWFAHQLPDWFQRLSVVLTYVIEIPIPFVFFAPVRTLRLFSFYAQVFLQVLIILTGNYNFFNLLTVTMCLSLLDDKHLVFMMPWLPCEEDIPKESSMPNVKHKWLDTMFRVFHSLVRKILFLIGIGLLVYWTKQYFALEFSQKHIVKSKVVFTFSDLNKFLKEGVPLTIWMGTISILVEVLKAIFMCLRQEGFFTKISSTLQLIAFSLMALLMFSISLVPHTEIEHGTQRHIWPVIRRWHQKSDSYQLVNSYGLFRSMTGVGGRPEIVIEGSNSLNGPWKEYDFLYKPGKLDGRPPFVAPHQPRLDWQMWFAALGEYNYNPWFVHLVYKLLHGEKDVLRLMATPPFKRPPTYIRAMLYHYHYTILNKENISSVNDAIQNVCLVKGWWKRDFQHEYLPILSKDERSLKLFLNNFGLAKDGSWPERPRGSVYRFVMSLRTWTQNMDPFNTLMILFSVTGLLSFLLSIKKRKRNKEHQD